MEMNDIEAWTRKKVGEGTGYAATLHDRCVHRIVSETENVFCEEARDILRIIASELEDTGAPAHLRVAAELRGKA